MNNKEITDKIRELSVPILETIPQEDIDNFKPYYQRYYEDKHCVSFNTNNENHDILLRFHTNRLILISISEGHDLFRQNKSIEKISFDVDGTNMLDITISGKKKAGAKRLKKESVLCYIKCKDDETLYPIYSCIPASLIEVNRLVLEDPQLLLSSYKHLGYIGVLYPKCYGRNATSIDKMMSKLDLLNEEDYQRYMSGRKSADSDFKASVVVVDNQCV